MNKKNLLLLISIIFISQQSFSQSVAIGQWRDHLPWGYTVAIEKAGNMVYCATPYGVIIYDDDNEEMSRLTKINGLSDIGISDLAFKAELSCFVIAYSNTNIDLIKSNVIINIPDIKRKQILGNKTINKVIIKDNYAYISCGFGIVVIDLIKEEVHDTYYIGPEGTQINVFDIAYNDTSFFAATEKGIYYASVSSPNLANFAEWHKITAINPNVQYNLIEAFSGKILTNRNSHSSTYTDTVLVFDGNTWQPMSFQDDQNVNNLRTCEDRLVIAFDYYVEVFDTQLNEAFKVFDVGGQNPQPNDAIVLGVEDLWIADRARGMLKTWSQGYNFRQIMPAGPGTIDIFDISIQGGNLWMVPGGMNGAWANLWKGAQVFSFINEAWQVIDGYNSPGLDTLRDMVTVAVNPNNPSQVFAGSWNRGLVQIDDRQLTEIYNTQNSSLEANLILGGENIKIGGSCFDNNGTLWVTSSGADKVLSSRTAGGEWTTYNTGSIASSKDVSELIIDDYNQKWYRARHNASNQYYLYVFNENSTSGKTYIGLNAVENNGSIPGSNVYSLAKDLDGEIWVGTDEGIAIFYNPEQVLLNNPVNAERPLVNFDGYVQYLLETEIVTCIDVDGANRKWVGTDRAGVFLLSHDGTEQVYHFTEDNSPLFSNNITDLAINQLTGEVFFGTSKGMIAFKGTATEPSDNFDDNVHAFPNPVKSDYNGEIGIDGLMNNSVVKITNVSGSIIYETRSEGGRAVWNGKDLSGKRAKSGVYLVFVSDEVGNEKMVTKILFLN